MLKTKKERHPYQCSEPTCRVSVPAGGWSESMLDQMEARQLCFKCMFWHEKMDIKDSPNVVRVGGTHYIIGREDPSEQFRGYGGSLFTIEFLDGRVVHSTNLWCQGSIPEQFRDRLPDNARFLQ